MKRIRRIINYLTDWRTDLQERLFVLLTLIGLTGMGFAGISNLVTGEGAVSTIVTLLALILFSGIIYICFRKGKLHILSDVLAVVLVFVFFPLIFFTSGGIYGGSPIWFLLDIIYIGMVIRGRKKIFFLIMQLMISAACYYVNYYYPQYITVHDRDMFFRDSFMSLVIVSIVFTVLVGVQTYMYQRENEITNRQKQEIDELSKSQSLFFSSMSHEIRTPINTIIGLNEMILREREISNEVREDAVNIQASSKLLLHLVNDILDMSRLQAGQMELTPAPYSVAEMLQDVVNMIKVRARDKGLQFNVEIAPELPSGLLGDEVRIKQIIINILNNAIKYTKEGSVTFTVQCTRKETEKENDEENSDAVLVVSVSDTGVGIKKESIPHLFTAFRRLDEDKNRYIEGTGLGLSIVREILDLMGGRVSVNSIYTKGSTFIVEMPQKIVDATPVGPDVLRSSGAARTREEYHQSFEAPEARVLIVDDTPTNLMVATKLLRATKVRLDTASNGEEALHKTLENAYHVIFMDHLMPGMDGIECMHRIRTQSGGLCQNSMIVALTANAGSEDRILYENEGFDGYLMKPVTGLSLETELYRLLPGELISLDQVREESGEDYYELGTVSRPRKAMITVTTESVADIPKELIERYHIGVIPLIIQTATGCFRDGIDIDLPGVVSYMERTAGQPHLKAAPVSEFEAFFARHLQYANHVIHISVSSKVMKNNYKSASEAAKAFENVTIVDTGQISSGHGLMVLNACRMAEEGRSREEILSRLEELKHLIHTSFIVENMDYLLGTGLVSMRQADFTRAFMVRPVISLRKGKMGIRNIYLGSRAAAHRRYIDSLLRKRALIDTRLLFVTYVELSEYELDEIRQEIEKRVHFEEIYFLKASPALSLSAGPGTFGLLFQMKK